MIVQQNGRDCDSLGDLEDGDTMGVDDCDVVNDSSVHSRHRSKLEDLWMEFFNVFFVGKINCKMKQRKYNVSVSSLLLNMHIQEDEWEKWLQVEPSKFVSPIINDEPGRFYETKTNCASEMHCWVSRMYRNLTRQWIVPNAFWTSKRFSEGVSCTLLSFTKSYFYSAKETPAGTRQLTFTLPKFVQVYTDYHDFLYWCCFVSRMIRLR